MNNIASPRDDCIIDLTGDASLDSAIQLDEDYVDLTVDTLLTTTQVDNDDCVITSVTHTSTIVTPQVDHLGSTGQCTTVEETMADGDDGASKTYRSLHLHSQHPPQAAQRAPRSHCDQW